MCIILASTKKGDRVLDPFCGSGTTGIAANLLNRDFVCIEIANLKRLCVWLEVLRDKVGQPIIINSGYRSPQLNRKVGGAANSNHLTGCAVDIRTSGYEQAIVFAAILIDYAKESQQEFDELLIERNRYGAVWLHFAVRPECRSATTGAAGLSKNRRKVAFISA